MQRAYLYALSGIAVACLASACGQGSGPNDTGSSDASADGGTEAGSPLDAPRTDTGSPHDAAPPRDTGNADTGNPGDTAVAPDSGNPVDAGTADAGGFPAGWLYTTGSTIYVSHGASAGTQWMGRGVNLDDIFLCGYNNSLWMSGADQTLETIVSGLMSAWHPSFVRISLGMASYPTMTNWTPGDTQYTVPMTNVINAIGANPNVYVLVTLRSHGSMIGQDTGSNDAEATGVPSDSTTTPDSNAYPTGTDATYIAIVDSFAHSNFVLFGLTNEPGGSRTQSDSTLTHAMSHAVGVIRAEEDRLGVPHHIVSVQGNDWTSDISFYDTAPLPYDNVVYEVHGYPPPTNTYTYSHIPVILGEYGQYCDMGQAFWTAFYADVEAKHIPNLAWDFEPYSDCSPDLVNVTTDATMLNTSSPWGGYVQRYLTTH